ncbi:UDP-glucose 6-dehydrogenase [Synergistales bacterium]|nr:UDP-glucose 6-dehydrogenase [Synergistales bacterium]
MNISVIGLGKLGLCTATCIASKGHKVVGVDSNQAHIQSLENRACPIQENRLEELLEKSFERMTFTADYARAIQDTDVTLIIVPTPSGADGAFINDYVLSVLKEISPALALKKEFHIVDVVSTVMPGSSEKEFIPFLEKATAKKCGVDFGFVYNPEFIALGSVIHDFLNPDMVLIGQSDEKSGQVVQKLYEQFVDSSPRFAVMSLINAEITKLALNCFVTMKITYANELARVCGAVNGADVDVVTQALGADTRVGGRCLKGGLGFAGPCFPRDNIAFQKLASDIGANLFLSPNVVKSNDFIVDNIFKVVTARVKEGSTLALLGFAYKPGTHITERSQSLLLMERFLDARYCVAAHDPAAKIEVESKYKSKVTICQSAEETVLLSDGALLLTPWPEYLSMDWASVFAKLTRHLDFFDCWRAVKEISCDNVTYWGLGSGGR